MGARLKLNLGYCPEGNGHSIKPFDRIFGVTTDIAKKGFDGVDAVVFWGGSDIHPSYYGQNKQKFSQAGDKPSQRDIFEWKAMQYCKQHSIPMIGVCRGAQLMTAFVGGKLIQHVSGHHQEHTMTTFDGTIISTTSCHHQMMFPFHVQHELLAWSSGKNSAIYINGDNEPIKEMENHLEPEVVYYPQILGLAIQGHPEWAIGSAFADYCNELVSDLLIEHALEEC